MKLSRFFTLFLLGVVITFLSSGCNKDSEPIDVSGTWKLDPANVGFYVDINEKYLDGEKEIKAFFDKNKETIKNYLKDLQSITITYPSSALCTFSSGESLNGAYTEIANGVFTISNISAYPEALSGMSDGNLLEIYYSTKIMDNLLARIAEPEELEYYRVALKEFTGIALFRR